MEHADPGIISTAVLGGDALGVSSYVVWNLGDQQSPTGYDVSNTVMQTAWGIIGSKARGDGLAMTPSTIRQIPMSAAITLGNYRAVAASAVMLQTLAHSIPASAVTLQPTSSRVIPVSLAALSGLHAT